jgi:KGK domain
MTDRFESLEQGEVISVRHDRQVLSGHRTFRAVELSEAISSHLESAIADWNEEKKGWFSDRGIDCEALLFGSNGWQKGRIRVCLEFCPDESNSQAQSVSHQNRAVTTHPNPAATTTASTSRQLPISPSPNNAEVTATASTLPELPISPDSNIAVHPEATANTGDLSPAAAHELNNGATVATTAPAPEIATTETHHVEPHENNIALPVMGIAAIGTVTAAAAISTTPERHESNNLAQSPLVDTILELETEESHGDPNIPHHVTGLDEISFDFNSANNPLGINSTNGMMELDLTDLSLDFTDHDLLTFEVNGLSDNSEEFANFQDLGQPENSGMLIDEVWNEMNQDNWPKIN